MVQALSTHCELLAVEVQKSNLIIGPQVVCVFIRWWHTVHPGQCSTLFPRPDEASYQLTNLLVHPPSILLLFILFSLSSSSSSYILLPLYSSSSCHCAGMLWCICLWYNSSPYVTTVFWLPPSLPLNLLLFLIPSCHHTEASVSACLSVANKVSPLFVGASFWRGRPSSKLIVHSLAFACRNLTT